MPFGVKRKGILAGQFDFYGALDFMSRQCGKMLDGDVLFAAESPADEFVFNDNALRFPTEHDRDFFARVVDALVSAVDFDSVFIRQRHGALRFQKSVLRKRRDVCLGDRVLGVCQSSFCVSARYVARLAEVSRCVCV